MIATAGGAAKLAACRAAGADAALDYRETGWLDELRRLAPQGCDVVYDPVGGDIGIQSLRCLAFGARYLIIGFAGGALTSLAANRLLLHNASAVGVLWGEVRQRDPTLARALTEEIHAWHAQGQLRPLPGNGFSFEQAPEALAALDSRASTGKVWLDLER